MIEIDFHAPTGPGFYPDVPEWFYHADEDSLSVSGAKTLLRSPAAFRYERAHPVHKDVFDVGTAFHTKVLGVGPEIVVIDAASWQGKAAQEERERARAEDKTPILAKDDIATTSMAYAVRQHPQASVWLEDVEKEISGYAFDPATGVLMRCRYDVLGATYAADLKSTKDASPEAFAKDCANYRYHQQAAWYLDVAQANGHPALGFAFIAVEKTPPYWVAVYELDEDALDLGRALNRQALDRYHECIQTGEWPGYGGDTYQTLSLPRWAYAGAGA